MDVTDDLVRAAADGLVRALAEREGVVGAHLEQLDPDVQREYIAAATLALNHLGLNTDPRRN